MKQACTESLKGKRILVTGGTTGIGRATSKLLALAGAQVFIYGRNERELQDALNDIRNGVKGMTADQANGTDIQRVFEQVDEQLGGLDILINNAAIAADSVVETDYEATTYAVHTNLIAYMECCRQARERMLKAGQGDIVNIGSISAVHRSKGSDIYTGTKSGLDGFTEAFRKQVVGDNIRVSLIEPGLVGTDMTIEKASPEEQPAMQAEGKMLSAEDIARCVEFVLCQPRRCDVIHIRVQPHREDEE